MLYMAIVTWDPDKRDEVVKRWQQIGSTVPEGMKVLGEWIDLSGGRSFRLVDIATPDPRIAVQGNFAWNDLVKIESVAVMEPEEMMKLMPT